MTDAGSVSSSTWSMRRSVSVSSPFEALTTSASGLRWGAASAITRPTNCDGLTETTSAASRTAAARSRVARRVWGSATSGR